MKIHLLYGTIEGQTGKIAGFVADRLRAAGHVVEVTDTAAASDITLGDAAAVILAASVHERRHPQPFEATLSALRHDLAERPTLMLSVSLNAAFDEGREEAQDYLTEMKMRTGLEPTAEALVAGAVRNARYDYFSTQVIRHVLLRDRDVNMDKGPFEFTDWDALEKVVVDFVEGSAT